MRLKKKYNIGGKGPAKHSVSGPSREAADKKLDDIKKAVKDMIEAREKISKLDVQIYDLNEELESYKNMSIFQFIMKKMRAS